MTEETIDTYVAISLPELGAEGADILLAEWLVELGAPVETGEPLFAIETDKAVFEVEAEVDGVLDKIYAKEGDVVTELSVVGRIRRR